MSDIVERLRDHILDQDKEIARLRACEAKLVAALTEAVSFCEEYVIPPRRWEDEARAALAKVEGT